MSWDVDMVVDAGGPESLVIFQGISPTYNLRAMFELAFADPASLDVLDGKAGTEARPLLVDAIADMSADPAKFRAMNPANGWGDSDGALLCLRELRRWCEAAPRGILRVH